MKPAFKRSKLAITIYDVAKKAGVGIATVSRALNDNPHILPETKTKVLEAVKTLKYSPHVYARGLAGKKTQTISVIVPILASNFYYGIISGIQKKAREQNYDLILYSVDGKNRLSFFLDKILLEKKVDSVILVSMRISDSYARKFNKSSTPLILVDSYHPKVDSIITTNESGAYSATKHLIDLGHKDIGFIVGKLSSIPAQQRYEGYVKALKDFDLKLNDTNIIECESPEFIDGFSEKAGYQAMKKLLSECVRRPTAVFLSSDIQAIGAMKALREQNIKVPGDISIVGFDDIELSNYLGLTTIRQPIEEMGSFAVQKLFEKRNSEDHTVLKKIFQTELVIRNSSGYWREIVIE